MTKEIASQTSPIISYDVETGVNLNIAVIIYMYTNFENI